MKQIADLKYQMRKPEEGLRQFIKCFWELENLGGQDIPVTILPDGYFDILFLSRNGKPFQPKLVGLATSQASFIVPKKSRTYAISFKLPSAEYILHKNIGLLLDGMEPLPVDFWGISQTDFFNIETFIKSASTKMKKMTSLKTDARKLLLFSTLYETDGDILVKDLANRVGWKSRQINRYFRVHFGLSLKKYCNILRFRASFEHLHKGQLYPEQGYFDQPHFIRDVHKFSGVSPKQLAKNNKDLFIQFSMLPDK